MLERQLVVVVKSVSKGGLSSPVDAILNGDETSKSRDRDLAMSKEPGALATDMERYLPPKLQTQWDRGLPGTHVDEEWWRSAATREHWL